MARMEISRRAPYFPAATFSYRALRFHQLRKLVRMGAPCALGLLSETGCRARSSQGLWLRLLQLESNNNNKKKGGE